MIVDRTRDQFFSRAGLAANQYGRIRGGYCLDEFQYALQFGARSDDFLEVGIRAKFILKIKLFLLELLSQLRYLPYCERILNRDGHLLGDLRQEINVFSGIRNIGSPAEN